MMVTRIFVNLSKGTASARRIAEVLEAEPDLAVTERNHVNNGYHIEFDNVTFSYNKTEPNISGLSFGLKRGQTLGIIGATGSGKTTIVSLLMRFYDPDSGVVRIDGDDIRGIPDDELRSRFGVVLQNDFLMADTILENIRFGRDISDEDIIRAAEVAQADAFIREKEDGYNYVLTGMGTNLSGGQKQRLLIAHASVES